MRILGPQPTYRSRVSHRVHDIDMTVYGNYDWSKGGHVYVPCEHCTQSTNNEFTPEEGQVYVIISIFSILECLYLLWFYDLLI